MAQVQQSRSGYKYDLQDPEADMRDGELPVVAHVLATGLHRVANQIRLLITPNALRRCSQHQDPEDEKDAHPYLADDGGVRLDAPEVPITHLKW
uniref:Uncharacterized protein n=1 Tax=Cyprinus carpio TaxID=7962 RepID=A0A8C1M614_CYPCA